MSRANTPGGRFTSAFERGSISSGIDADLKNPVGSSVLWYLFDSVNSAIDPIYDTGDNIANGATHGKIWSGPFTIPTVRTVIKQGSVKTSAAGFYNADTLHITLNSNDIEKMAPGTMYNPDFQDRSRVVWKGQVFRPVHTQQTGIINEDFILLTIDCVQVMPEEMVNDPQFLAYSN